MRREVLLLEEIVDAAQQAQALVVGVDFDVEALRNDRQRRDALLWNFTVLGEAASQLPVHVTNRYPSANWRRAIGLRNRIIHGYWSADLAVLVATARDDLPHFVQHVRWTLRNLTRPVFVPEGFIAPRELATDDFVLEPLGPQHNESDHAWTSSIDHIRTTAGYPDGDWPPVAGMTLEENLSDLIRHAEDFELNRGFTFTVLDPGSRQVIGCVYLYPPERSGDVTVQSWVSADCAHLDGPLAEAVAGWLRAEWPWQEPDFCGRF